MDIGPHCSDPYECSFTGYCWKNVPEYSVFNISRIGDKAWDLHSRGVLTLKDIPRDYPLNAKQWLEVECERTKKPHIDADAVKEFVDDLEYPLYYFDFETFNPVIPLFEGTSPYQVIPFQYSLHCQDKKGGALEHMAYLGDGKNDPTAPLMHTVPDPLSPRTT